MNKYTKCQIVAELIMNEDKLINSKKGEVVKILYTNNVNDNVSEMILDERRRAKSRRYTRESRDKARRNIKELQNQKENLKTEKQILDAEIHFYEDLLKK